MLVKDFSLPLQMTIGIVKPIVGWVEERNPTREANVGFRKLNPTYAGIKAPKFITMNNEEL